MRTETGFEITKRNVVYQSANEEEGFVDEQYSFVKIPEKTESIRVGDISPLQELRNTS